MRDLLSFYEQKNTADSITVVSVPLELGSDERGLAETPEYLKKHGLEQMFATLGCEIAERQTINCPKALGSASAGTMKHVKGIAIAGKRTKVAVGRAAK